jgi:succinate dehydrogenase / fumarate reductase cytochrome b subunit
MLTKLYRSPVGKKVVTGITGIALSLFVLVHMTGNLAFFADETGEAYNRYSHFLTHQLGFLFYAIEIGLLLIFVLHFTIGINIWLGKRKARPRDYETYRSAGGASRQTLSSRSMILTGVILLAFTAWHLLSFKYGTWYASDILVDGEPIRDIALLVREKFQSPLYGIGYPVVMLLMGFHLRHGVWSALQSLGAVRPSATPAVYGTGAVVGFAIAIGFLVLPLAIFFQFV